MTPRPRPMSGTSESGNNSSFLFSPTAATVSPATGRQLVDAKRIEPAIGGEQQELVGGLAFDREAWAVALLILEVAQRDVPAPHRADPTFLGTNNRAGLALDQRFHRDQQLRRRG